MDEEEDRTHFGEATMEAIQCWTFWKCQEWINEDVDHQKDLELMDGKRKGTYAGEAIYNGTV